MNILITGGASGLGEAITRLLAKNSNNTVYFSYRNSDTNAKKIENEFPNTISIRCDFGDIDDLKAFTNKISKLDLDVLINNAYSGAFLKTHFHKIPSSEFLNDFKENIIPIVDITQVLISQFRKKKKGKIITILTAALVNIPPIGSSVYISNKSYLESLSKIWAVENSKFGITSNTVSPSLIQTSLTNDVDKRIIDQIIENHPLKKLLTVEEVAETILFLTQSSNHINGIDIVLNAASNIK